MGEKESQEEKHPAHNIAEAHGESASEGGGASVSEFGGQYGCKKKEEIMAVKGTKRNIGNARDVKHVKLVEEKTEKGKKIETLVFKDLQELPDVAPEHRGLARSILTESIAELMITGDGTMPTDVQKLYAELFKSEDPAIISAKSRMLEGYWDRIDKYILGKNKQKLDSYANAKPASAEVLGEKSEEKDSILDT